MIVADSTTVNLYKLAAAALDARPGRAGDRHRRDNFPTDRYVLAGPVRGPRADAAGVPADIDAGRRPAAVAGALDADVAVVVLSHVAYRSGRCRPAGDHRGRARRRRAGAVGPVALGRVGAGGAGRRGVGPGRGCTYKYLNGGPGSPAYLYVRADLQAPLRQPIQGWFGAADQFAMGPAYDPAPAIDRFLVGTPPVLSLVGVEEGARVLAEAGIDRLRAKGAGDDRVPGRAGRRLAGAARLPAGLPAGSGAARRRTSRWSTRRPGRSARPCSTAAWCPDYRTPDRLRLGPAPLTTRFTEVYDALAVIRDVVSSGAHRGYPGETARVT